MLALSLRSLVCFLSVFIFIGLFAPPAKAELPAKILQDIAYGPGDLQKLDVYLPKTVEADTTQPIILMVHGGGWRNGKKSADNVVANKVARWVPAGFVFVSINYPLLPEHPIEEQADSVALAIARVQAMAPQWNADPDKIILMGHSAGAHLVSLVNAVPSMAYKHGAKPWLGAVALDSAAIDVERIMGFRHPALYDDAFGTDATRWKALSPIAQISKNSRPWMGVCSKERVASCEPNLRFARELNFMDVPAQVSEQKFSHGEINDMLGMEKDYTRAVESFMSTLDPKIAATLREVKN